MPGNDAPGALFAVQDLANAHFVEEPQADRERAPETIASWLARHGLARETVRVTPRDRQRLLELRRAIRALLAANDDDPLDAGAVATLNRIGAQSTLRVSFDEGGGTRLTTSGDGVDAAIAHLLAIVLHAQSEGTWERLKLCRADDCRWAFYDASKNRSGAWCTMRECGNRAKARAWRRRHARNVRA